MVNCCPVENPVNRRYLSDIADIVPSFHIHMSTSELAKRVVVDPTAMSGESRPGIYDENGDYIPQYCDNPEDIPQGVIAPNVSPAPQEPSSSVSDAEPSSSSTSV